MTGLKHNICDHGPIPKDIAKTFSPKEDFRAVKKKKLNETVENEHSSSLQRQMLNEKREAKT